MKTPIQPTPIRTEIRDRISEKKDIGDDLFLQLFRAQSEYNQGYRKWLLSQNIQAAMVNSWQDIPALPTDAFKSIYNPSCLEKEQWKTTFYTSGTTTETKGAHHFESTDIYEQSILAGWDKCGLPELHQRTLILTPSAEEAPHSSLSHMMDTLKRELCPSAEFVFHNGELDLSQIQECLHGSQPVTLLGTALAFLALFDQLGSVELPL